MSIALTIRRYTCVLLTLLKVLTVLNIHSLAWLKTVPEDLISYNLTLLEAANMACNWSARLTLVSMAHN